MQYPGGNKGNQRGHGHRPDWPNLSQLEMGWIKEKLHHEVFPVDINAAPEVGEACGEIIQVVSLGKVKTKHEQQTHNEVESS